MQVLPQRAYLLSCDYMPHMNMKKNIFLKNENFFMILFLVIFYTDSVPTANIFKKNFNLSVRLYQK